MNDDIRTHVYFSYAEDDTQNTLSKVYSEAVTWPEVLNDILRFVEGIYGYSLRDQVTVKGVPLTDYAAFSMEQLELALEESFGGTD